MSEAGYRSFLELGYTDKKDGKFISFNEKEIELDVCSNSFIREIDERGKIQSDLRGGNISFVISRLPPEILLEWVVNSNKYFSGYIHIRDTHGNPKDRVFFENAAFINIKLTYVNEGSAYFSVQGLLQAETMQLPGAKMLMNHWTKIDLRDSTHISKAKEKAQEQIGNILNREASIGASMLLKESGITYELQSFQMEFGQNVDHKGEPMSSVRGGIATVGFYSLPDHQINKWLMGREEIDLRILFGDKLVGYELAIELKKSRCIGYFTEINTYSEENVTARINIAPLSVSFGDNCTFKVPY